MMQQAGVSRTRQHWRHRRRTLATHTMTSSCAVESDTLRIGFYSNHLCERGSEIALFDYADFAESIRGAVSYILYDSKSSKNVPLVIAKFQARFGDRVIPLGKPAEIVPALKRHSISHAYIIKFGHSDEPSMRWFGSACKKLVHCVFDSSEPHGDVYARISPCVPCRALSSQDRAVPVVPHIVRPCSTTGPDLRSELGIPASATVFGRHGGADTFDIPEVRRAVLSVARDRSDIYFLLMNTAPFADEKTGRERKVPSNIIHLDMTMDEGRKAAFIRTCDAMLHARLTGETFGLAVAEFSVANRPVLSSIRHHECGAANFHIRTLDRKGLWYHDQESCEKLLRSFDRKAAKRKDWNAYSAFEPAKVMQIFWDVFIDGKAEQHLHDDSSSTDRAPQDAQRPVFPSSAPNALLSSSNPFMRASAMAWGS